MKTIAIEPTFESWQAAARTLLREEVPPTQVRWHTGSNVGQALLLDHSAPSSAVKVPRESLDLARQAAAGSDPARWQVLYDTLWRLTHDNRDLLKDAQDPGVRRLRALLYAKGRRARWRGRRACRPPGRRTARARRRGVPLQGLRSPP